MSGTCKAKEAIDALRPEEAPIKTETKLTRSCVSFQTTLMKQAVVQSGRDLDDPGTVEQFWFEDKQMLVIDLSGGDGDE